MRRGRERACCAPETRDWENIKKWWSCSQENWEQERLFVSAASRGMGDKNASAVENNCEFRPSALPIKASADARLQLSRHYKRFVRLCTLVSGCQASLEF